MIKAYIPVNKRQGKSGIRGLWRNDKGEVFYNYLRKVGVKVEQLPYLKKHYRQEAIFYKEKSKAYIWYNTKKQDTLRYYDYFSYKGKLGLKVYIKDILKRYGGFTVYVKRDSQYLFEVWH